MSTVKVKWIKDLTIIGEATPKSVYFDNRYKEHTKMEGSAPTDVFLMSIVGCSLMSAVSILDKQMVKFDGIEASIEAETQSSVDNPYHFTRFRISYNLENVTDGDFDKISKAIELSHNKYCPMIFMAEKIAPVQYEIFVNNTLINKSENWEDKVLPICDSEICDNYYTYTK